MFRNQYDSDITIWSPQGRIHQIEYAMEAVKQGSAAVGLRSNDYVVILGLKRSSDELAAYQKKLIRIDDHMGIAIAGLTSDARVLSNFMRNECMKSKFNFNRPLPVEDVVTSLSEKSQVNTQQYGKRPYGVGLLIAGYDKTGPHLYEYSPSGNCYDYIAMSIGSRSQSARTYFEKFYKTFAEASLDDLIKHGLRALRDTVQQDKELTIHNCSLGIVGKDKKFVIIEEEDLKPYLEMIEEDAPAATTEAATENAADEAQPMDTDTPGNGNAMYTE